MSWLVVVIGCLVLAGWALNVEFLKSVSTGLVAMNPITALAFILAGTSLWLARAEQPRAPANIAGRLIGGGIALVGTLVLLSYLLGWNTGVDQLLFRERLEASVPPNRMAPNTALNFLLVGLGLLLLDWETRRKHRPAQWLTLMAAFIALLALIGYAYGVPFFYGVSVYFPMTLHGAVTFLLLCLGILCVRPDRGMMAVIMSDSVGGVMARRLLPAAILIPIMLGGLRLWTQRVKWSEPEQWLAFYTMSSIVVFAVLIWANARLLHLADLDRKRAETDLKANEARTRSIIDTAYDAFVGMDSGGCITGWNHQAEVVFGWSPQEALGRHMAELIIPAQYREAHERGLEHFLKTGEGPVLNKRIEITALRRNGEEFPVELTISPVRIGETYFFSAFIRDITERKRLEEELRAREEQYHSLADAMPQIVWTARPDGWLDYYNKRWFEYTGMTLEQTQGWGWGQVLHPDDLQRWLDRWNESVRTGATYEIECRFKRASDGAYRWHLSRAVPVRDTEGKVAKWFGTCTDIDDQKQAEEALRESEGRFRHLFEDSPDAVFVEDFQGTVLDANLAACQLHGLSRESLIGKNFTELVPPDQREAAARDFPKLVDGQLRQIEGASWTADGRAVPVEVRTSHINYSGKPALLLHVRDITERKAVEEALKKSEQKFRHVWEDSLDGMRLTDAEGKMIFVNSAFCQLVGKQPEELLGRPFTVIYMPENQAQLLARYKERFAGRDIQPHFEREIALWDGGKRWVELSNTFLEIQGEPPQVLSIVRDITERKQAETALEHERYLLHSLMDNAPDLIYFKDLQGRYLRINQAHARLFGAADPVQLVGKTDFDFFAEEHARQAYEDEQQVIRTGEPVNKEEMETWPNGSVTWALTTKLPLRDESGQIVGTFGLSRNITGRKRTEEELKKVAEELARSNRELELFAYVASHDLQEPLRMVASYTQLLGQRYHGKLDPDADEFIGYAVDGAKRMQALINDLLTYSRVQTKGKELKPTDCEKVFDAAVRNLQIAIEESHARVTHDPLPTISGDDVQLIQLFQNLIGNAIKFRGDKPPEIHVGAQRQNSEWVFSVRDNGIGIEEKYFERIFVIFQRLHSREEYPGTGIGLAVCKKIVERHGGRISVESEPGKGSTFRFTMPVVE